MVVFGRIQSFDCGMGAVLVEAIYVKERETDGALARKRTLGIHIFCLPLSNLTKFPLVSSITQPHSKGQHPIRKSRKVLKPTFPFLKTTLPPCTSLALFPLPSQ